MLYNHIKTNAGTVMPLIMACTPVQNIESADFNEKVIYDPIMQTTVFDTRTIGTNSLKSHATKLGPNRGTKKDQKNEIDDSKSVK